MPAELECGLGLIKLRSNTLGPGCRKSGKTKRWMALALSHKENSIGIGRCWVFVVFHLVSNRIRPPGARGKKRAGWLLTDPMNGCRVVSSHKK